MSPSKPIYDATVDKICRELSGLSPIAKAMLLRQVCRVLALPTLEYGEPEGLSTPSPPQADPTFPQATAIGLLLNAAKSAGIVTAKCTVNLGGTLVLELQLGPQMEK